MDGDLETDLQCGIIDCSGENVSVLSEIEQVLVSKRSGSSARYLCEKHRQEYLKLYEFNQRFCCDPFEKHRKRAKPRFTITLEESRAMTSTHLIPGKKLCNSCKIEVRNRMSSEASDSADDGSTTSATSSNQDNDTTAANALISTLNVLSPTSTISPIKTFQTNTQRKESTKKRKLSAIYEASNVILSTCLDVSSTASNQTVPSTSTDSWNDTVKKAAEFDNIFEKMKSLCLGDTLTRSQKLQVLSICPNFQSREKFAQDFNVSERIVTQARSIDFMALPPPRAVVPFPRETKEAVIQFYEDDQFSRLLPGKKDRVSIGKKEYQQKRLILLTLKELFQQFKIQHPDIKIGFSKFCTLRPKWCVVAGSAGTHAVCVCLIHENPKLLIESGNIPLSYKELLSLMVCDVKSRNCMLNKCDLCPSVANLREYLQSLFEDTNDEILFKQWTTVDRAEIVTMITTVQEFIETLIEKLAILLPHSYISKAQMNYYKAKKEALCEGKVLITMDFAENYSFQVQNEVQGFHWTNSQVTVHPVVCYYKSSNSDCVQHCSLVFLSNILEHNVHMVYCIQKQTIEFLRKKLPALAKVEYFTDGSAAQYKNFKSFLNLLHHKNDFGIDACWSFHATSHGKGPCDGIGGSVKRATANESLRRSSLEQITNVVTMYTFCRNTFNDIHFEIISSEDIEATKPTLEKRFRLGSTLKGTRSFHYFEPFSGHAIGAKRISSDSQFSLKVDMIATDLTTTGSTGISPSICTPAPGSYIAIAYDQKWYIACVIANTKSDDVEVDCMHPHGPARSYHWPVRKDKCLVSQNHVVCNIKCPNLRSVRGQYNISTEDEKKIISRFAELDY